MPGAAYPPGSPRSAASSRRNTTARTAMPRFPWSTGSSPTSRHTWREPSTASPGSTCSHMRTPTAGDAATGAPPMPAWSSSTRCASCMSRSPASQPRQRPAHLHSAQSQTAGMPALQLSCLHHNESGQPLYQIPRFRRIEQPAQPISPRHQPWRTERAGIRADERD